MNDGRETKGGGPGADAADAPPAGGATVRAPRVVVADDSAFMRRLVADSLMRSGAKVVAEAANGREAVVACREHQPDVLCLDLAMPELDGIAVLGELGGTRAGPGAIRVVVISSFNEEDGMRAVDALAAGAFDLVPKLAGRGKLGEFTELVSKTVFAAAETSGALHRSPPAAAQTGAPGATLPTAPAPSATKRLVVIASSTGGPRALTETVPLLPEPTGRGVVVIQHMPVGFTRSLAKRLDDASAMHVAEAAGGEPIDAATVLVAPGGHHTHIRYGHLTLGDEPPVKGLRPCADVTIADAVAEYGGDIVLAVLTGMGDDGLAGARQVRAAGGVVLAEDPSTCIVYGMPKAVVDAGLAHEVLPIGQMAAAISRNADG